MSFVAELKQRKVFRVATVYLVVAWVAVQAASIALPAFDAPVWVLRVVILLTALGFPFALVLAWALDASPGGLRFSAGGVGTKRIAAIAALLVALALVWYFRGQPALRSSEGAAAAGVGHYVALSVVGTERIPDSPYLRAKNAQEALIKGGGIPYTIVHATQFFEFIKRIADEATEGSTVRLPPVLIQPMAAEDVAKAVGKIAVGVPVNGTVDVAGPQQFRFDELIRLGLSARNDPRQVVVDPHARYFGAELDERALIPAGEARLGEIRLQDWLVQPAFQQR